MAVLALAAGLTPALATAKPAKPAPPDLKAALTTILAARETHFASLKGEPHGDSGAIWQARVAPPGMRCRIETTTDPGSDEPYSLASCDLEDSTIADEDAQRLLADVRTTIAAIEPAWAWAKETEDLKGLGEAYYAGPSGGGYIVTLSYLHVGDESSVQLEVDDRAFKLDAAVEPVAP